MKPAFPCSAMIAIILLVLAPWQSACAVMHSTKNSAPFTLSTADCLVYGAFLVLLGLAFASQVFVRLQVTTVQSVQDRSVFDTPGSEV